MSSDLIDQAARALSAVGVAGEEIERWRDRKARVTGNFDVDCDTFSAFFRGSAKLLAGLPAKPLRGPAEHMAADALKGAVRAERHMFLRAHVGHLYDTLTAKRSRFLRVDEIAFRAADLVPGLVPTGAEVAREAAAIQRDKEGVEIDQGILLSHVLAAKMAGRHLCHAMLLPRLESSSRLPELAGTGAVDLGRATVERRGRASVVTMKNPKHLNAEDATTIGAIETSIDLALLDPATEICVLRGGPIHSPKYRGRRVFGSGINLTHLYYGRVPFLWYLTRELGVVNKLYRGLAKPDTEPWEPLGESIEKLWVAAVESFAIGGHCQYLLTMDCVIAERGAFMTLPARKEGIIPGAANLRLPRFVGGRLARDAIMRGRQFECASPEGRLICDEIVEPGEMDAAIDRTVSSLTESGVVSAVGNRRAFRVTQEPIEAFLRYAALYTHEQADCHFSPVLVSNLERYWNAQHRTVS